jgi:uncharacterized protein (TIGR01777 family)
MKIFITGGTGFVGRTLSRKLSDQGHEIAILTRSSLRDNTLPTGVSVVEGDPTKKGPWQDRIAENDAIINLAGASIFKRWTDKNKKDIRDSRVMTTQNVVSAMSRSQGEKIHLLSTSAVGYYGFRRDEEIDENKEPGDDFLAAITKEWESTALEAEKFGARVVLCRFGIVLGSKGGALEKMLPLFKANLGSPLGSGNQWFSWIHEQDLVNIFLFLIEHEEIRGPVNVTAPQPVTNREFTKALGTALNKFTFMPSVPGFMLKLVMGEFGSVLLKGQRVFPKRLLESDFRFDYPDIHLALRNVLS